MFRVEEPSKIEPPESLGRYTIRRKLGEGGMGQVHLAHDPELQRDVALKLLHEELRGTDRRARFLREARAVAQLSHPNITTVHEVGEVGGRAFIAFEYVDGKTLTEILETRKLGESEIIDLALLLAEALEYAHGRGVIHRDIKTDNVMVTKRGRPKLLDFGLAKLVDHDADEPSDEKQSTTLTKHGEVFGTPGAMSPEQALGRPVDERSDVFSFGSLLYQMACCVPAFCGDRVGEVIDAVINAEPAPLDRARPDLPLEFTELVAKALRKDPGERYQSMADLAADLRHLARTSVPARRAARRKRNMLIAGAVAAVATIVGYWTLVQGSNGPPGVAAATRSIAVLPFTDLSPGGDMAYFGDGMAEELINALTRGTDIDVAGRTSAFSFRAKNADLRAIGEALGVGSVLEGSIRRSGERIRISARLSRTDDQKQLWSETFERDFNEDIFDVQDEISSAIVASLAVRLAPGLTGTPSALDRRGTAVLGAYDAYLRGRYAWSQRTRSGFERAISDFQEAITLDPDFARAQAGLAEAYAIYANYRWIPPSEAFPLAERAVRRALELDPNLADAHRAQAVMHHWYEWDFESAEREFRRALELNPGDGFARYWYSILLDTMNRPEEAESEALQAAARDPLALQLHTGVGDHYRARGDHASALRAYREILALDPDFENARHKLVETLILTGQFEAALEAADGLADPLCAAARAAAHAELGDPVEARRWLDLALQPPEQEPDYLAVGSALARLGDLDEAFEWIERGVTARAYHSLDIVEFARLDEASLLGADPRHAAVLRELGLDRFW